MPWVQYDGNMYDLGKLIELMYNRSKPIGLWVTQATPGPLADGYAERLARGLAADPNARLDYLLGRPMKLRLVHTADGLELDRGTEALYDRDQGRGTFLEVLAQALIAVPDVDPYDVPDSLAIARMRCGAEECSDE